MEAQIKRTTIFFLLFGRFLVYSLKFDRMTEPKEVNILIETGKAGQRFFSKKRRFHG